MSPAPIPSKPKKILVIDDEHIVIDLLSIILSKKGFSIISASDGDQAVQVAFQSKPDMIILDMMMPAGSGGSVYNRLKQSIITQKIPIIFLTALNKDRVQKTVPDIDPSRIFTKPWVSTELVPSIEEILGNR